LPVQDPPAALEHGFEHDVDIGRQDVAQAGAVAGPVQVDPDVAGGVVVQQVDMAVAALGPEAPEGRETRRIEEQHQPAPGLVAAEAEGDPVHRSGSSVPMRSSKGALRSSRLKSSNCWPVSTIEPARSHGPAMSGAAKRVQ